MSRKTLSCGGQAGFTLLEVMVAMGVLATAYIALLEAQSGSMRLSTYGKQITLASFLAQYKMEETEQKLTKDGFPAEDEEEDGNFEEQGCPSYRWKIQVKKIELPLGEAFGYLLSGKGSGAEGDKDSTAGMLGKLGEMGGFGDKLQGSFGDLLKGKLGGAAGGVGGGTGGGMAGLSGLLNPDMLKGQAETLATMLEQALREVQLTVSWDEGGPGNQLVVTTHLVQVPQAPTGATGVMPGGQAGGLPGGLPGDLPGGLPGDISIDVQGPKTPAVSKKATQ